MTKDKIGFGLRPTMDEVPPGQHAIFRFTGPGKIIDTEKYGEKYSFPIEISYHISYDSLPPLSGLVSTDKRDKLEAELEGQTVRCNWETKCQSAKQLYYALFSADEPNRVDMTRDDKFALKLEKHYEKDLWRLTRFDTGAYWLEVE